MINTLIKKLHRAAEALEALMEEPGTPAIAGQIRKTLKPKKLHWTQRPENKKKLAKAMKRMAASKKVKK